MYAIAIHGGAGVIKKENISVEEEKDYIESLNEALNEGLRIIANKGSSIDAVEAAVINLENNELFNAGRGSVFTSERTHEMEASIMNGLNLDAGAVCGIKNVKNPISLARAVMDKSNHLFLSGSGAEKFAKELGVPFEKDDYFFTQKRFEQLVNKQQNKEMGTVGAVALDSKGNVAAATSTGGLTNKNYGRIGDCPVIGAGTYANNLQCAVSCTGDGEYIIRSVAAYDVFCLMEYKGLTLAEACKIVVHKKLKELGGDGGLIAIDKLGNIEMVFNSEGMYRAAKREGEKEVIGIFNQFFSYSK